VDLEKNGIKPLYVDLGNIDTIIKNRLGSDRIFSVLTIGISNTFLEYSDRIKNRLFSCILENEMLVRAGDHIFFIFTFNENVIEKAASILEKCRIMHLGEKSYSCSIGISRAAKNVMSLQDLLKSSQKAMKESLQTQAGGVKIYGNDVPVPNLDHNYIKYKLLSKKLKNAIRKNELFLVYQPQVDVRNGHIFGIEALLRWKPKDSETLIPPSEFIPIAEKSGQILSIGHWVLQEACWQSIAWQRQDKFARVSVNMSVVQLLSGGFVDTLDSVLSDTGINPDFLEIEITESIMLKDLAKARKTITEIRKRDIRVALDDFGMEFNSLKNLSCLPLDMIKIDKSFVKDIVENTKQLNLVQSIIGMAKNLDVQCLAEGVETPDQAALLKRAGCYFMQGLFFLEPDRTFPEWEGSVL